MHDNEHDDDAEPSSQAQSPLALAMARLEAQRVHASAPGKVRRIDLRAIRVDEDVFNVRGHEPDEYTVNDMVRLLAGKDDLRPILVIPIGNGFVVVDGHYRLEAYRQAKRKNIPAHVFAGSVAAAVLEAVSRNAEIKTSLDNQQRQTCGWRLVLAGFKNKQIIAAAGISQAQVTIMRKAWRSLGDAAFDHREWWQARQTAEGREDFQEMTDEQHDAWMQAKVEALAGKIKAAIGPAIHQGNPELVGRAVALLMGRHAPETASFIMDNLTPEAQAVLDAAGFYEGDGEAVPY